MSPVPSLTREDFDSRAWERLSAYLNERLQSLREDNDSGDADATAKRRGRIAEVKELLALPPKQAQRIRFSPPLGGLSSLTPEDNP